MLRLSKTFVLRCAEVYERHYGPRPRRAKREIKAWVRKRPRPRFLDRERFMRLAMWKSRRGKKHYLENDRQLVIAATRTAYQASHPLLKLHSLRALRGVDVAVGATILHFFYPGRYPIFDLHARKTLRRAGRWQRGVRDDSAEAWLEYIEIMRGLSRRLRVSLRTLDKALYARDRWPQECRRILQGRRRR